MPSDGKTIHSGWYIDEKVCSLGKYYVQSSEIKKGVYVPTYIQKPKVAFSKVSILD